MPEDSTDRLRQIWTAEQPSKDVLLSDLLAEAASRRGNMVWVVATEIVLTLGLVALTVAIVRAEGPVPAPMRLWLGPLWLTWVVVASFAIWNRRGVWAPNAETAQSYLALAAERAHRRRRAALFVLGLTGAQAFLLLVIGKVTLVGLLVVALYAGWALWYARKARRDADRIRRIASEFREEEEEGGL